MRKLISTILALCMVLCLLPVTAAADDANPAVPTETVKLDVGAGNQVGPNNEYEIADDAVKLLAADTVYELTGTTSKKVHMWGSNSPEPVKTFYLRLNGATINGGITIWNPSGAKLVIEVVDGTTNIVQKVYAVDLTITGAGTINADRLGVTQSDKVKNLSKLYIKDTKIVVTQPTDIGDSDEWNGACVLDGSADVTYTSTTKYSALKLGETSRISHSLTMKGNAKLHCLQADIDSPSSGYVSGLEVFYDTPITLQDNAYLEAQGRAGVDSENGYTGGNGILSNSDITVKDNATIKATAYGDSICLGGDLAVIGGKIDTKSEYGAGVFSYDGAINISDGATVDAEGNNPALYGTAGVSIANSTVTATSVSRSAIYSKANVDIQDSVIKATSPDNRDGILAIGTATITGSWIETSGNEEFTVANDSITNSVLFNGKTGKVIGNAKLLENVTLENDMTLNVPAGTSLTVPDGMALTNNGTVKLLGDLYHSGNDTTKGDLICNSHSGGTATCTEPAKCDICQKPYGDKDPGNHVDLKHVPAAAPTVSKDGNIEYWFCPACGKYFADANTTSEIAKEDTVIPALKAPSIKPADGKGVYTKNSGKDLVFTTENMPEEIKVKVGSTVLTEGKDYTVSNGSIVLKTSYLESLGYGSYTLVVTDANGVELARTSFTKSFTVRPAQQPALSGGKTAASGSGVTSAGTGDAGVAMYAVSAVLSLTGSAWVVGKKRK